MTLAPFYGHLSSQGVMTWQLRLLGLKTLVQQDMVKIYPFHILQPGVIQLQGIKADPQPHIVYRLDREFRDPLRGLICAINVSAQHYPPCCTRNFNILLSYSKEKMIMLKIRIDLSLINLLCLEVFYLKTSVFL